MSEHPPVFENTDLGDFRIGNSVHREELDVVTMFELEQLIHRLVIDFVRLRKFGTQVSSHMRTNTHQNDEYISLVISHKR